MSEGGFRSDDDKLSYPETSSSSVFPQGVRHSDSRQNSPACRPICRLYRTRRTNRQNRPLRGPARSTLSPTVGFRVMCPPMGFQVAQRPALGVVLPPCWPWVAMLGSDGPFLRPLGRSLSPVGSGDRLQKVIDTISLPVDILSKSALSESLATPTLWVRGQGGSNDSYKHQRNQR